MKERFAALFATKTRDEWEVGLRGERRLRGPGALPVGGARPSPHARSGAPSPRWPAWSSRPRRPRFVGTPGAIRRPPPNPGQHGDEALVDWGLDGDEVADCAKSGAITGSMGAGAAARPRAGRVPAYRLTTGQVTVRVIPSMSWMAPTTMRPSSSTVSASARTMTS